MFSFVGVLWISYYVCVFGVKIGEGVDLYILLLVIGMLIIGVGVLVEFEVDFCGYWIDGDLLWFGVICIGVNVFVGVCSILLLGICIGKCVEIVFGLVVFGWVFLS